MTADEINVAYWQHQAAIMAGQQAAQQRDIGLRAQQQQQWGLQGLGAVLGNPLGLALGLYPFGCATTDLGPFAADTGPLVPSTPIPHSPCEPEPAIKRASVEQPFVYGFAFLLLLWACMVASSWIG